MDRGVLKRQRRGGYILPVVIMLSLAVMTIGTTSLGVVVQNSSTLNNQDYKREALQAANAGVTAAANCLNQNSGAVTWSTLLPLTPQLDCHGTILANISDYSFNKQDGWKSTFRVDAPTTVNGIVTVTAVGTVKFLSGGLAVGTPVTGTVKANIGPPTNRSVGTISSITAGLGHTCALTIAARAFCWGDSTFGQIGDNDASIITKQVNPSPRVVSQIDAIKGKPATSLSAGGAHTCMIVESQSYCFGGNGWGQMGNGFIALDGVPYAYYAVPTPMNNSTLGGRTMTSISTRGSNTSCGIASGKAFCWGDNGAGQSGGTSNKVVCAGYWFWGVCIGILFSTGTPPIPVLGAIANKNVVSITAGLSNACGIDDTGAAYCWGIGNYGQLGQGTTSSTATSVAIQTGGALTGKKISSISPGSTHTCALAGVNNELFCWGDNRYGQIGNGVRSTTPVTAAVNISAISILNGKKITSLEAGAADTCVVADNKAYCWGKNDYGQLGLGFTSPKPADASNPTDAEIVASIGAYTPTAVSGGDISAGRQVTQISLLGAHTCAVADLFGYCWGYNANGQLGNGGTIDSNVPIAIRSADLNVSGRTAEDISTGASHTCAISSGKVICWGQNAWGQLGNGEAFVTYVASPTSVAGTTLASKVATKVTTSRFTFIVGGDQAHSCVIADGDGYCWGANAFGQLGSVPISSTSSENNIFTPQAVKTTGVLSGKKLTDISAGWAHTCAVANDQRAYCWGNGISCQLGNNACWTATVDPVAVTTTVGDMLTKNVSRISSGWAHTCAIAENLIYCWGNNGTGQLGNGTTTTKTAPKKVLLEIPGQTVSDISSGYDYSCAVVNSKAYCWGNNASGQLGQSPAIVASSPIPLEVGGALTGKTVTKIATADSHTCAIANGDTYCWGNNGAGQLGDGTTTASWSPVLVPKTGWLVGRAATNISVGTASTCMIVDIKPYCWGNNSSGQLGDSTISTRLQPTLVFSFENQTVATQQNGGGGVIVGNGSGIVRY